jgi:hypothetical protein
MLRFVDLRIFGINAASKNVEDGHKHTNGLCTICFIYLGCNSGGCTNTNLDTFKAPMEGPCNHCAETGEKPHVRCNLAECKKCQEIYTPLEIERLRLLREERKWEQRQIVFVWEWVWLKEQGIVNSIHVGCSNYSHFEFEVMLPLSNDVGVIQRGSEDRRPKTHWIRHVRLTITKYGTQVVYENHRSLSLLRWLSCSIKRINCLILINYSYKFALKWAISLIWTTIDAHVQYWIMDNSGTNKNSRQNNLLCSMIQEKRHNGSNRKWITAKQKLNFIKAY